MTVIVVTAGMADDAAVLGAFREETSDLVVIGAFREETRDLVVVPADKDMGAIARDFAGSTAPIVVAASPSAAGSARVLQAALGQPDAMGTLPFDDAEQRRVVGTLATDGQRLSVAMVSRAGAHVCAGVYEDRHTVRNGQDVLRARVSVPAGSPLSARAESAARGYLDHFGVHDGATTVELEIGNDQQLVRIEPAVASMAPPTDASFRAFGHSHQHLLTESILRPREFERRLVRPLQPGRTTLAVAALRTSGEYALTGAAVHRVMRRLTGFHSVGKAHLDTASGPGAVVALAAFVHPDRASVINSLTILAEMEDAGIAFTEDYQLIGLAPTAS